MDQEIEQTFITILDVAKARGAKEESGTINGSEFSRLGLPMLSGCEYCHATLGPYNAYPSKSGYIRCDDCIGDLGFKTIQEFDENDPDSPMSINEVLTLFDDLALEIYYGSNFKQVMMATGDSFMHELRKFVDRARTEREALES